MLHFSFSSPIDFTNMDYAKKNGRSLFVGVLPLQTYKTDEKWTSVSLRLVHNPSKFLKDEGYQNSGYCSVLLTTKKKRRRRKNSNPLLWNAEDKKIFSTILMCLYRNIWEGWVLNTSSIDPWHDESERVRHYI